METIIGKLAEIKKLTSTVNSSRAEFIVRLDDLFDNENFFLQQNNEI